MIIFIMFLINFKNNKYFILRHEIYAKQLKDEEDALDFSIKQEMR